MEIRDGAAQRKSRSRPDVIRRRTRRPLVDTTAPHAAAFPASGKARFIPGIGLVVDGGGLES